MDKTKNVMLKGLEVCCNKHLLFFAVHCCVYWAGGKSNAP